MDYKERLKEAKKIVDDFSNVCNHLDVKCFISPSTFEALQTLISFAQKGIEGKGVDKKEIEVLLELEKNGEDITKELNRRFGFNQSCDLHLPILARKDGEIEELKKHQLTKEEFYTIACEYRPSIAEDSQQPEWTRGELDKLWEALTHAHWLYINRDEQIEAKNERIGELEKLRDMLIDDCRSLSRNLKPWGGEE